MPITLAKALRHQKEWLEKLRPFPTRAMWPNYLFHTCQLAVAAKIIRDGAINCRQDVDHLICDVANQGALWNNPNAHQYVRLYFRPRNSFHLKTEGVKAIGDRYRSDPHMSLPVAFAFKFRELMTSANSGFVPGNFAKSGAAPQTGDAAFDELPFDLIYHDAALPPERLAEVHNWRMSEVVVRKRLLLDNLACVICRTTHEERTLRYSIKNAAARLNIIVEQRGSVFMRHGMSIDEIYWIDDHMQLKFHGPAVGLTKENYSLTARCDDNGSAREGRFLVKPNTLYRFVSMPASRDAVWRIELEDCLVYNAPLPSASGLVS
jgi:hypothetical protein